MAVGERFLVFSLCFAALAGGPAFDPELAARTAILSGFPETAGLPGSVATRRDVAIALARLGYPDEALDVAHGLPAVEWDSGLASLDPLIEGRSELAFADPSHDIRDAAALAYVRRRDTGLAVNLLSGMPVESRGLALVALAQEAWRSGDRAQTGVILSALVSGLDQMDPRARARALLATCQLRVAMDDVATARGVANRAAELIRGDVGAVYGSRSPSILNARAMLTEPASATDASLANKAEDLADLAVIWKEIGDQGLMQEAFAEGRQHADRLEPRLRAATLREIALRLGRCGDFQRALRILDQLGDYPFGGWYWDRARVVICHGCLQAGELDQAEEAYERIADGSLRTLCSAELAASLAGRGDLEGAVQVAEDASDDWGRARALLLVAAVQAEGGDVAGAVRLADGIDLKQRPLGLDLPNAIAFSWRRPATWAISYYNDTYSDTGTAAWEAQRACDLAAAAMLFEQVVGHSEGRDYAVTFADEIPPVLRSLTRAHAATGDTQGALAWAVRLPSGFARTWAILGVADALVAGPVRPEFVHAEQPPWELAVLRTPRPAALLGGTLDGSPGDRP